MTKIPNKNKPDIKDIKTDNETNYPMWLAQYIARAGVCSRREAIELIKQGKFKLNDQVVNEPAVKVTVNDKVKYKNKLVKLEQTKLWLFHKPKGCITTTKDPQDRITVFSLLPKDMPRVISVGRLDYNTEGLLLLTNDGDLARFLESPESNFERSYRVRAHGKPMAKEQIMALEMGISIEGVRYKPALISLEKISADNCWYNITIFEGKNREVRKIFSHFHLEVNRLIRTSYGPFKLGNLKSVGIKEVSEQKINKLLQEMK